MMRNAATLALVAVLISTLGLTSARAQGGPALLNHEGLVLDSDGLPLQGQVNLRFSLYSNALGGAAQWREDYQLDLVEGYYSVRLGSLNAFGDVFAQDEVWLGIKVNGGAELSPRQRLVSVPYAMTATNAVGDITPHTVSVGGQQVIDEAGRWTGAPIDAGNIVGQVGDADSFDGHDIGEFIVLTDPDAPLVLAGLLDEVAIDADLLDGMDSSEFLRVDDEAGVMGLVTGADGTGSGLDADLLDGLDSGDFLRADDAAAVMVLVTGADGTSSGLDADRLDGMDSTEFLAAGDPAPLMTLITSADGANSGLDADLFDGLDSGDFLRKDQPDPVLSLITSVDGANSGLDADRLDGRDSNEFLTGDDGVRVMSLVTDLDGAGSHLDADRLDGMDSSEFLAADDGPRVMTLVTGLDGAGSGLDADRLDGLDSNELLRIDDGPGVMTLVTGLDGTGSGLDADQLDGRDSSEFLAADDAAGVMTLVKGADGDGSGLDADRLDGRDSTDFLAADDAVGVMTLVKGADGDGSGLDADRLDGKDSSQFLSSGDAAGVMALVTGADGSGSGLDADRLDGLDSTQFMRADTDIVAAENFTVAQTMTANAIDVEGSCQANCYRHDADACVLSPRSWTGNQIISKHDQAQAAGSNLDGPYNVCPDNYAICPAHLAKRYCGPEDVRSGTTGGNPYARHMWVTGWTLSTCRCTDWDTARSRSLFTQHYGTTPIATSAGAVGCPAGSHMAVNTNSPTSDWNYFICAPDTVNMYVLCCNGNVTNKTW